MKSAVVIDDFTVSYREKPVLWDVDVTIPEGSLTAVVGPNGAGKSTLLKAVLGIVPKLSGRVTIYGEPYEKNRHLIAYVPQRETVDWDFPTDVLDIVTMGTYGSLGWFKRPGEKEYKRAMSALKNVGMEKYAKRQIGQLSGGQQQRVFLARALAQDAQIYFMDEPFSGVDAATEKAIIHLLRELKQQGKTVVCVHHDLATVGEYFDWGVFLNVHVIVQGPIKEIYTAQYIEKTYGESFRYLSKLFKS